jgi:type IV secretion system protein VirD4
MSGPLHRDEEASSASWEVPTAFALAWLVTALMLLPGARAVLGAILGGRWLWPGGGSAALVASIGGLLTGDAAGGLSPTQTRQLPSPAAIYLAIGVAEACWLLLSVSILVLLWRRTGRGVRAGMASISEIKTTLGRARLHAAVVLVRPDLRRRDRRRAQFDPTGVGWHLGRSRVPRGVELWVPYDRTCGVYGPQGSGKTLDLLAPALLSAPGAALVTLTKVDDLLLTVGRRAEHGRPVGVLDPFGLAPGLPELVWDPVAGCGDPLVAERRAKAFTSGALKGAVAHGFGDDAARFYAAEAAKVLQAYLHAAALSGLGLDAVIEWIADPMQSTTPEEILRTDPHAAPHWHGLLVGALRGDPHTAGNTVTTVQQATALFFQPSIRARCVPDRSRPATDLEALIRAGGTVYLLGRDDPYASAAPLMTAVAEHVLDTALHLANSSTYGRLCPPFLACLDELPSTAPLPTLRTRMANERALGISFIYAAQTWRQLVISYGEDEARALFALTNTVVVFGGGKDGRFYTEVSDLLGTTRRRRTTYSSGRTGWGRSTVLEDEPVMRPEEIRQLRDRSALVLADSSRAIIAKLTRCVDGRAGRALLAARDEARGQLAQTEAAAEDRRDRQGGGQ